MPKADGGKFATFDISFFDPATQLDYVADRSNASVALVRGMLNSPWGLALAPTLAV
jgi:hypothetical protein